VPREVKAYEYRVAITPSGVHELVAHGHEVFIESGAGEGSSITDAEFAAVGARIATVEDVWGSADMVLKVKEPQPEEFDRLRRGLILFTYLHLAASRQCTDALIDSGVTGVAYETVQYPNGMLPLLYPMSEVAGRMSTQVGAHCLEREIGGRGVLMGGVSGVQPARVVVLGAGVVGSNAAAVAVGMGADTVVLDRDVEKLRRLDALFMGRLRTIVSNAFEIREAALQADLIIGAVLVTGAKTPKLVTRELVAQLRTGSVLVDVSIDQGGCFEDSRPTTHADPAYQVEQSIFYCVANMPGAVPHTSTYALTNVTVPYAVEIADDGLRSACSALPALAKGVSVVDGLVTYEAVAEAHDLDWTPLEKVLDRLG
jgi:alanine dehydrogenase